MNTYYLIDYENVGDKKLSNCNQLDETDHIHIFYTGDTTKINLDILSNHGDAELVAHKIPSGNQSVDMHLVSFLGYLLGINKDKDCSYVIISKDKDYDNVIRFWKNETKNRIVKAAKVSPASSKEKTATGKIPQKTESAKQIKKKKGENKIKLNHEVQQALGKKGYQKEISGIAKIVCKHYGTKEFVSNVHNALRKNYDDYLEIYKIIKPVISKYV